MVQGLALICQQAAVRCMSMTLPMRRGERLRGGETGVYNIAEDDGAVSINKAAEALGWVPGFRLDEHKR